MEVKAFAGIDVGKAAHMRRIVDAVGNVLAGSFPFANDAEGFSKLLAELRKAGCKGHNSFVGKGRSKM